MTAVEFTESIIHLYYTWIEEPYTKSDLLADLEVAKEMHKNEVKDGYNQGFKDGLNECIDCGEVWAMDLDISECSNAEDYYNENFKK